MKWKNLDEAAARRALRDYDWQHWLIFPFGMERSVGAAVEDIEDWIIEGEDDWGGRPSCLLFAFRETRIQGPAIYLLVADATDTVDDDVELSNKDGQTCISIPFASFPRLRQSRRNAIMNLMRGFVDRNCYVRARLRVAQRLAERRPKVK